MLVKLKHLVLFLFLIANATYCCEPEPGAQHFPTLEIPQPRIRTGYFQVHNRLNGLPSNEIMSVIEHPTDQGNYVIAGSKDRGIMVFAQQQWYASNDPSGKIKFPETTVTSLVSAGPELIYAGTPLGLISIKISKGCFFADKIYSASPENLNVTDILIVKKEDGPTRQLLVACDRSVGNFISETYTSFSVPDHIIPSGFNAVGNHGEMLLAGWSNGLLEISGQRLESFVVENDPCGWVTDIQSRGDFFYVSSANGLFKVNSTRAFENMLPGIWTTCFTFTADPGEKPASASEKVAIEDATGISAEDSPEYLHLLNEYNQLQQDFQDYVSRNSSNRFATQAEVDAMWDRFSGFETKKQELIGAGVTVKNTMAKGLWIGTKENGLIMYDKTGMNYHMTMENSKLPSDNVTCMCSNEEGEVWIGTENGGLLHYSKQNQKGNQTEKLLESCKPVRVRQFADLIMICTENSGLHIYRHTGKAFLGEHSDKTTKGLPSRVNDVAIDKDGNLWMAGNTGVWQWNSKKWVQIPFRGVANQSENEVFYLNIDSKNRIFAATRRGPKISNNIFFYDGTSFLGLGVEEVAKLVKLPPEKRKAEAEKLGLTGDFMREFDFGNATQALLQYDSSANEMISAIMNTEHYLTIGTNSGMQFIFDGESFKQLSVKGTGSLGPIKSFARLPGGEMVIQGNEAVSEFNGQHYKLINSPGIRKINDLCLDSMNPETYRIAFESGGQGGYALYQEPHWQKYFSDAPVISIAQADKTIYLAKPDGVYYLEE